MLSPNPPRYLQVQDNPIPRWEWEYESWILRILRRNNGDNNFGTNTSSATRIACCGYLRLLCICGVSGTSRGCGSTPERLPEDAVTRYVSHVSQGVAHDQVTGTRGE